MANSFLSKLLGGLKSFLQSMASPLGGFGIDDAKINVKDGEYSVLYQFGTEQSVKDESTGEDITNVRGEKIPLNVLLSTANVKEAFAPLLEGMNNMGTLKEGNPEEFKALMYLMLGDDNYKVDAPPEPHEEKIASIFDKNEQFVEKIDLNTPEGQQKAEDAKAKGYVVWSSTRTSKQPIMAESDNAEYLAAKEAGRGLLGIDLENDKPLPNTTVTFKGEQWSWEKIAGDYLRYSLECEVPGKDYGAIQDVALSDCAKLIPEYLTKTNTIVNGGEVKPDLTKLVKPLLVRMQADLVEYFTDAYNKEIEKKTTSEKEAEKKAQQEAEQNPEQQNQDQQGQDNTQQNQQQAEVTSLGDNTMQQQQTASKQIKVTLRKIQGSTDFDVLALESNYNHNETLDDLDDIISQDEFMGALTEDPQSFNIGVDDDGYDIETTESFESNPCESIGSLMQVGIKFYRNLYILHWMAKGNDMMKLHLLTEEMYEELIKEIDTLGELMVEKQGTVISPSFECNYLEIKNYDFQEGIHIIEDYIQEYLSSIDYAYPNQTSDVQSTLDEWIRYWNKQLNYFVERQEI